MSEYIEQAAGYTDLDQKLKAIRPLADIEREYIEHVLALTDNNIALAAKCLKISPSTLYRKKLRWA